MYFPCRNLVCLSECGAPCSTDLPIPTVVASNEAVVQSPAWLWCYFFLLRKPYRPPAYLLSPRTSSISCRPWMWSGTGTQHADYLYAGCTCLLSLLPTAGSHGDQQPLIAQCPRPIPSSSAFPVSVSSRAAEGCFPLHGEHVFHLKCELFCVL